MKHFIFALAFVLFTARCEKDLTTDAQRQTADRLMNEALTEANSWLSQLNENGYAFLKDQAYPAQFDTIMQSAPQREKMQKYATKLEQEFGRINQRHFFGAHVLFDNQALTYVPSKMQAFKLTSPKRLGVTSVEELYQHKIPGSYVLLMYTSMPMKKQKAEELISMWQDEEGTWWCVGYYLDDEI